MDTDYLEPNGGNAGMEDWVMDAAAPEAVRRRLRDAHSEIDALRQIASDLAADIDPAAQTSDCVQTRSYQTKKAS